MIDNAPHNALRRAVARGVAEHGAIVAKELPPTCQWFVLCTNNADGLVDHPILGAVPTCRRCAERCELTFVEGSEW